MSSLHRFPRGAPGHLLRRRGRRDLRGRAHRALRRAAGAGRLHVARHHHPHHLRRGIRPFPRGQCGPAPGGASPSQHHPRHPHRHMVLRVHSGKHLLPHLRGVPPRLLHADAVDPHPAERAAPPPAGAETHRERDRRSVLLRASFRPHDGRHRPFRRRSSCSAAPRCAR